MEYTHAVSQKQESEGRIWHGGPPARLDRKNAETGDAKLVFLSALRGLRVETELQRPPNTAAVLEFVELSAKKHS
jgi:hypothetical protein